jgi:hypothetical protein
MIKVLQPPAAVESINSFVLALFLAGSIEMGTAEDWQKKLIYDLQQLDVVAFNPRRDDWDPTWEQTIANDNFRAQVIWELDALDRADLVVFYFDPNTTSPITLMELGMQAEQQQYQADKAVIVCCPDGYFRKGNVDIVCKRYGIQLVDSYPKLVKAVKKYCTGF